MLPITDLSGNTELLTNISGLTRKRKVNGEKSLAFFVVPDESNEHAFGMVDVESIVEFDGEEYVIKVVSEKNVGLRSIKEVNAVHKFFCDMIDSYKYEKHTGSMTFASALQFVFKETGYNFVIVDTFYAQPFENFGDDNKLALLQTVLERFGAEFYVVGKQVYFKREIGNDTDFQFRYAHNVKTIDKQIETQNLATYIKGYGKQNEDGTYVVEAEYTSPNAAVLGIRHAPAVRDERYTTEAGLLERLKNDLIDEPQVSIKIDFADLRASGYLYAQPGEGDYGYIIYEPMGLDVEARIVEVDEEFNANLHPIKADVTLSNIREGLTDVLTRFEQTSKQVGRLLDGRDQLPYSALDEAVRIATEALQSAQTELEFNNGIIAREKTNPNKLVVFNSAGIGISTDGGNEFNTAMTADGVVADVITVGTLRGIYIEGVEISGSTIISSVDVDTYTKIEGAYLETRGDFKRTWLSQTDTHDTSMRLQNGYFRARNNTLDRSLYFSDFGLSTYIDGEGEGGGSSGSILWWDKRYSPSDANGLTINSHGGVVALESDLNRIVLNANLSVNLESRQSPVFIRPKSAVRSYGQIFNFTTAESNGDGYLMYGEENDYNVGFRFLHSARNEITVVDGAFAAGGGTTFDVGNLKVNDIQKRDGSLKAYWNGSGTGTTGGTGANEDNTLYASGIRPRLGDSDLHLATDTGGSVRVTNYAGYNNGNGLTYRPIVASEFNTASSRYLKKNIENYTNNALEAINSTPVRSYHLNEDIDEIDPKRVGLILEESPVDIVTIDNGQSVNIYAMASLLWKAVQELSAENEDLKIRLTNLETV